VTVLVTGGSGLVGSHVVEALRAAGERVRALVREPARAAVERLGAEPVVGDVTDAETWRRAARGVDAIVHTAAIVTQPVSLERYLAVNVGGTRLAAEAASRARARLVHVSSVAVYGRTGVGITGGRVAEDFPFQEISPRDFYTRSKRTAEQVLREAAERDGVSVVVIRPNVIYGERDRHFAPRAVRVARLGLVPVVGRGTNRLSCVYAGNVAGAIVAALGARLGGFRAYNTTDDAPPWLSQRQFAAAFAQAVGRRPRVIRLPLTAARAGVALATAWQGLVHPRRYAGLGRAAVAFITTDNPYVSDRARRELGWKPHVSTPEAVTRTARWFAANQTPGR
jgi:nucleoside-diphosphate-sugar epimerase